MSLLVVVATQKKTKPSVFALKVHFSDLMITKKRALLLESLWYTHGGSLTSYKTAGSI